MPVFVLILNKCDEPSVSSAISSLKLDDFCRENDITAWFGASAKDGENVDNALEAMVAEVVQDDDRELGAVRVVKDAFDLRRLCRLVHA